jgi:hypothetical protein
MKLFMLMLIVLCTASVGRGETTRLEPGEEDFAPVVAPGERVGLGVNWAIHPRTGYGVLGHNIIAQLYSGSFASPFFPVLTQYPHSQSVLSNYPTVRIFRTVYAMEQKLLRMLHRQVTFIETGAPNPQKFKENPLPYPLLHALDLTTNSSISEGTYHRTHLLCVFAGSIWPLSSIYWLFIGFNPQWGLKNAAFVFLETEDISADWIKQANTVHQKYAPDCVGT